MNTDLLELAEWLKTPKYWEGVRLYGRLGDSEFLKELFEETADAYNREKLHQELKSLHEQLSEQATEQQSSYPPALVSLLGDAQVLMDERSDLKSRMRLLYEQGRKPSDLELHVWRVLEIKTKLDLIYSTEGYYKAVGELPPSKEKIDDTEATLLKRLHTVRTYLSKYEGKAAKAALYDRYQKEATELEYKLKQLGVAI